MPHRKTMLRGYLVMTLGLSMTLLASMASHAARPGAGIVNPNPEAAQQPPEQQSTSDTTPQTQAAEPSPQQTPATDSASQQPSADTQTAGNGAKPYAGHVQCEGKQCQIDLYLTWGYRTFSQCQVCHGLTGDGSTIAPSLMQKLKEIDRARFVDVVTHGFKGQIGVMPAWGQNPNVMKHIDELYAYLKARSDGVLPAGPIERYDR